VPASCSCPPRIHWVRFTLPTTRPLGWRSCSTRWGRGPCLDAYHEDRPVLEPDLANPSTPRWFGFAAAALEADVRALFGFPLHIGSVRLGALNLYRDRPGPLSGEQHADALVMADVAAHAVLVMQAEAPPGVLAAEFETAADLQHVVHQASGMVSAQLDVDIGAALIRLRSYSFGNERARLEVAEQVVGRRLRFDDSDGYQDSGP
jgi:GAF domain-containing protein